MEDLVTDIPPDPHHSQVWLLEGGWCTDPLGELNLARRGSHGGGDGGLATRVCLSPRLSLLFLLLSLVPPLGEQLPHPCPLPGYSALEPAGWAEPSTNGPL